jgi:hypothetical protein
VLPALEPQAPETPSVVRSEPEELREGGSLKVVLDGGRNGAKPSFQFRTGPEGSWQPAPDGMILLKNLKPGPLTLEFRSVDRTGRLSPVGKRVWTVLPLPTVKPRGPGLQEGDEFYQEVVVSRVSHYRVAGVDLGQNVQYTLVSRFTVTKKEADGTLKVRQKVEAVRLTEAERGLQAQLNELLQKTRGATFRLTLNPRREVVVFEGDKEALKVFTGVNPLGGTTFLLWSFLDQDGWKELAEVSLFQPRQPSRNGDRWTRPIRHSWGPLGYWQGQVAYLHLGTQHGLGRYDYLLDLAYRPPAAGGR